MIYDKDMSESMPHNDYNWFISLAKSENMSHAADTLFMTQSTISRKLARLERNMGVQLFDRQGKSLRINQFGTIVFEHFSRAQAEMEQAYLRVHETITAPIGQISLGFLRSLGPKLLPQIIEQFQNKYPQIQFHFEHADTDYLCELVISGTLDLAIFPYKTDILLQRFTHLHTRKLFTQALSLVVHENHPYAQRENISLAECAEEEFILPFKDRGVRTIIDNLCATAGFTPKIMYEVSDIFTTLGFISTGRGIAILPIDSLDTFPRNIRSIHLNDQNATRDIVIIWSSQHPLLPAATILRDFCIQYHYGT